MSGTFCVYSRPSMMECDMYYGRPSVMKYEYHAYVCKTTATCNDFGGWRMGAAEPEKSIFLNVWPVE